LLAYDQALAIQDEAESLLQDNEFVVNSLDVLQLVRDSEYSAYDCEFVALAQNMKVALFTMDKSILKNFINTATLYMGLFHNLFALSYGSIPGTYNHQNRNHKASQNRADFFNCRKLHSSKKIFTNPFYRK
jgi:hypothetical protein